MEKIFNLHQGEIPLKHAPKIQLNNGALCIPQHYLLYQHSLASVEQIIMDIDYCFRYPVFACQDNTGLYIQVGVVGIDNYSQKNTDDEIKIVYGRKWRVEPQLPTSEIIQTVFLAIKKAREHEVRELFRLQNKQSITTPFNNHHDLPLMAKHSALFYSKDNPLHRENKKYLLVKQLASVNYDGAQFKVQQLEQRSNGQWLLDIEIIPSRLTQLPEIQPMAVLLQLDSLCPNEMLFKLFESLLKLSDRHVDENFSYQTFARFSNTISLIAIAEFSSQLRNKDVMKKNALFAADLEQANYLTDKTRIPVLNQGKLAEKIKTSLASLGPIAGIVVI